MGSDLYLNPPPRDYGHNAEIFFISLELRAYLIVARDAREALRYCAKAAQNDSWLTKAFVEKIDSLYTNSKPPFILMDGNFHRHIAEHANTSFKYLDLRQDLQQFGIPVVRYTQNRKDIQGIHYRVNVHHLRIYAHHARLLENFLSQHLDLVEVSSDGFPDGLMNFVIEERP